MAAQPEKIGSALDAATIDRLYAAARAAKEQAYAPHSKFFVGAAVLDGRGNIYGGCNVENGSFGLTMCAERSAVFAAVHGGAKTLQAVAIFTPTAGLTPPCGACRQVLAEFSPAGDMEVHLINDRGDAAVYRLGDLLPLSFKLP